MGDMIGAPYEFDRGNKTKDFPLFAQGTQFTDDSVMTIAVAEALMESDAKSSAEIKCELLTVLALNELLGTQSRCGKRCKTAKIQQNS